jgi:hypothetical protein
MAAAEVERERRPWVRKSSGQDMRGSRRMDLMSLLWVRMLLMMEVIGQVVKVRLYGMHQNGGWAILAMPTRTSSESQSGPTTHSTDTHTW